MGIGGKNQLVADGALMRHSIIPSILSCIPPGPPCDLLFQTKRGKAGCARSIPRCPLPAPGLLQGAFVVPDSLAREIPVSFLAVSRP